MSDFIPGLELSRHFFYEVVQPLLKTHMPDLRYAAGLIGSGSEVLGYDTPMSTDHHWGPRVMLFLSAEDKAQYADKINEVMRDSLPYSFRGYSTNFGEPIVGEGDNGVQLLSNITTGPVNHRVEIYVLHQFMLDYVGFDLNQPLLPEDWLSITQQKLLTLTGGVHDEIGLQTVRDQLAYYPHDVWLYMLMAGWSRIGQDEHLAPRAGYVGDEVGSAIIAGQLVRSIMQMVFLMERRYAPYAKWFGTAFAQLENGPALIPILRRVQMGETWQQREEALIEAYDVLNRMHNALQLTPNIQPAVQPFHGRPFRVTNAWRYIEALQPLVQDERVKLIAQKTLVGSIDLFSESTDLHEATHLRPLLRQFYI
jgi:hypothetical protein